MHRGGAGARGTATDSLPLYGIPFAVKDNIDVAGCPTTAACPAFAYRPAASAECVARLESAGAICIGKTNLDQFATGLSGVRSPYGACGSAYDRAVISGGSSSGSAVAVGLGQVSFTLGTDTGGSGRIPAAFNNVVGLKPTRGAISTRGLVPNCPTVDCVSVFARTVPDATAVAEAMRAFDAESVFSRPTPSDFAFGLAAAPLGFRFGVPCESELEFFGNAEAPEIFAAAIARLEHLGGRRQELDFRPFREAGRMLFDGPWIAERAVAVGGFVAANTDAVLPVTRSHHRRRDALERRRRLHGAIPAARARATGRDRVRGHRFPRRADRRYLVHDRRGGGRSDRAQHQPRGTTPTR